MKSFIELRLTRRCSHRSLPIQLLFLRRLISIVVISLEGSLFEFASLQRTILVDCRCKLTQLSNEWAFASDLGSAIKITFEISILPRRAAGVSIRRTVVHRTIASLDSRAICVASCLDLHPTYSYILHAAILWSFGHPHCQR